MQILDDANTYTTITVLLVLGILLLVIHYWHVLKSVQADRTSPAEENNSSSEITTQAVTDIRKVTDDALSRLQQGIVKIEMLLAEVDMRIDVTGSSSLHASRRMPAMPGQEQIEADAPRHALPAPDIRVEVYRLADEGSTAPQIAHQLGVTRGEVELLLNLRLVKAGMAASR